MKKRETLIVTRDKEFQLYKISPEVTKQTNNYSKNATINPEDGEESGLLSSHVVTFKMPSLPQKKLCDKHKDKKHGP